jgi:hypothetical protein
VVYLFMISKAPTDIDRMMWLNALKPYMNSEVEMSSEKGGSEEKDQLKHYVENLDSGKLISHGLVRLWAPTSVENGRNNLKLT